jgi:hypothetical protein
VVGIDTSAAQLATARRLQREHSIALTLIHGGPWVPATIDRREEAAFAWKIWSLEWQKPSAGEHTIVSRAIDTQGNIQPAMDDPRIAKKHTRWESNGQWTRRIRLT